MSEVFYTLKEPFSYARKDGDAGNAQFITLVAPNYKQMQHVTPLKTAFMQAVLGFSDKDVIDATSDQTENHKIEGAQVMQVLYSCAEVNMTKVMLSAAELFKAGAAMVEGEEKLTQPLIDKMKLDDFEQMVGEYIANFITPSLMDGQSKNITH